MTPITICANTLRDTLRHHGVEMHPDDIHGLAIDALAALLANVSEGMIEAGVHATAIGEASLYEEDLVAIFTAMLTAAINEGRG